MSKRTKALSVLIVSTLAFTVCFMVWMMFGVIGIPIRKALDLNATQFGLLTATPVLTGSLVRVPLGIWTDQVKLCVRTSRGVGAPGITPGRDGYARSNRQNQSACSTGLVFEVIEASCDSLSGVNSLASATFSSSCSSGWTPIFAVLNKL